MKLGKPLATGFAEETDIDETVTAEAVIPDAYSTPDREASPAPAPATAPAPAPVEAAAAGR